MNSVIILRAFIGAVLLTIGFLAAGADASAQPALLEDFNWWAGLTRGEQLVAIETAVDAYPAGWADGATSAEIFLGSRAYRGAQRHRDYPKFSHTFGFYASAVSDFYALHPSAHKASVGDIIGCLADNPSTSCNDLAKFLTTHEP